MQNELNNYFDILSSELDFEVSQQQKQKLVGFVELMSKWNKAYNLSSIRDSKDMLVKHIFDSIAVSPFLTKQRYADVGTGPGLPGVPLAIMHPDKSFLLIDSLGKRVRFIKQALYELKIDNVVIQQARVEEINDQKVDVVLSRAFASIKDMLNFCEHLIDEDGQFLALKGQLHQDELDEIPSGYTVEQTKQIKVPALEGERHLVFIKKKRN